MGHKDPAFEIGLGQDVGKSSSMVEMETGKMGGQLSIEELV
jgi:hypothetical protein